MFEQSSLTASASLTRAYGTAVGLLTEAVLLTSAVMVPLVSPDALPRVQSIISVFVPVAAPPPPAPAARPQAPRAMARPLQVQEGHLVAPSFVPAKALMIEEPPLTPEESAGGSSSLPGVPGGIPGGTGTILTALTPIPQPAARAFEPATATAKPPAATPPRIRVGGLVQEALLIARVIPAYPVLARQARVSGTVQLIGLVGVDGRIRELRVTSGHPLLVPAALDAVRRWIYRPTLLNGEPVEVVAPITVTFKLN